MIWLSALLVFGTLASIVVNLAAETPELRLGAGLLVGGSVPWVLMGALWGGVVLGAASLLRGRTLAKLAVLLLEIVPVAGVTWYVAVGSALPAHELAIDVGDPFPAYALRDQDEGLHRLATLETRTPALYVFYRGHW